MQATKHLLSLALQKSFEIDNKTRKMINNLPLNAAAQRKAVNALRLEKLREQALALLKQWSFLPKTPGTTYAKVVRVKCNPQTFVPNTRVESKIVDLTPQEAHRDWARAQHSFKAAQKSANLLAESIRKRYANQKEAQNHWAIERQKRIDAQKAANLLAASIQKRYAEKLELRAPQRFSRAQAISDKRAAIHRRKVERQENNFLVRCIAFRYAEKYNEEEHDVAISCFSPEKVGGVHLSTRGPCRAKKTPKVAKVPIEECWDYEIWAAKSIPFLGLGVLPKTSLVEAFSKTKSARYLWGGLLTVIAVRREGAIDRFRDFIARKETKELVCPEPQMDEIEISSGGSKSVPASQSTGVQDDIVVCDQVTKRADGFYESSASLEAQRFTTMTERWIYLETVDWKVTDGLGKKIYERPLLYNIIKDNLGAQGFSLLLNHRFYRTDIRVRVSLNSNKFQIGKLIIGSVYTDEITSADSYINLETTLQREHTSLYAGTKMGAELVIPYRYINSSMSITDVDNFGALVIFVQNPLISGDKTISSCSLSISVMLENSKFNGLCKRIVPQMDAIENIANLTLNPSVSGAINVASTVLKTIGSDNNRDMPSAPLQPMSFVPQATGSMCYTSNILEPINALRGDATGQVPSCYPEDHMSLNFVKSKWGLLRRINLTTTSRDILTAIPVVPLHRARQYSSLQDDRGVLTFVPPPIAALASCYSYFRGEIEFKIEIVASQYHKAKLMVSCVPYDDGRASKLSDIKFSVNQIYDIETTCEKIFSAPWQWKNAFCRTRVGEDLTDIPSTLYVAVVNPMQAISQVPQNMAMNIYIRGGSTFEVAIQRPPILSVWTNHLVPPENQVLKPYNTEAAMYLTYNTDCKSATGKYPLVPYIQNVVNGFVGYTNLRPGLIYKLGKTKSGLDFRLMTSTQEIVSYGTYDPAISTSRAHGLIVGKLEDLKKYIKETNVEKARDLITTVWQADGPWSEVFNGTSWVKASGDDYPLWEDVPQPQMEEPTTVSLVKSSKPTSFGLKVFGEDCPDLKSYCHRYQNLGTIKCEGRYMGQPLDAACSAVIRVNPRILVNPQHSSDNSNRWREGATSFIASWYRMWRGSLRYRFVILGSPPEGSYVYISHCHDKVSVSVDAIDIRPNVVRNRDDLMSSGYATYVHALSINSVISVEIPYYSEKEALSLYPTSQILSNSDNGCIKMWVVTPVQATVHMDAFYAIGDDCRFYEFCGIPRCMDMTTMAPEPQMGEVETVEPNMKRENFLTKTVKYVTETVNAPRVMAAAAKQASDSHASVVGNVNEILNKSKKIAEEFSDRVKQAFSPDRTDLTPTSWADLFASLGSTAMQIATHIFYAVISGTIGVISFAIFNILRLLWNVLPSSLSVVTNFVEKMWSKVTSPTQQTQGQVEPQMEDEDVVSYSALLFTTLTTFLGVKMAKQSGISGLSNGLFIFSKSARSGTFVGAFIKDNITLIKRVFKSIIGLFGSKDNDFKVIAGVEDSRLKEWLIETSCVLAPSNEDRVKETPSWTQKVFELSMVGRALSLASASNKSMPRPIFNLISSYMKDLKEIETKLVHQRVYSSTRYVPFSLWISGPAGCGKSTFALQCCDSFAAAAGYTGSSSYHPVSAGMKYMDGADKQTSIYIDDALSTDMVNDPLFIPLFLNGKSPGQLRLPFSRVEDKDRLINIPNIVCCSNFLDFCNIVGIHDVEAFNRRRDLVLLFNWRGDWNVAKVQEAIKSNDPDQIKLIKDMAHVSVSIVDPMDSTKRKTISLKPGETYHKTVSDRVMLEHSSYHDREADLYANRHRIVQERIANAERSGDSFDSHIKAYKEIFVNMEKGLDPGLSRWLSSCKQASGGLAETPAEPQMNGICVHAEIDPQKIISFVDPDMMYYGPNHTLVPFNQCEHECILKDPLERNRFYSTIANYAIPEQIRNYRIDPARFTPMEFPEELLKYVPDPTRDHSKSAVRVLEAEQTRMQKCYVRVGGFVFNTLLAIAGLSVQATCIMIEVFSFIYKTLFRIGCIAMGIATLVQMFSWLKPKQEPQLEHSGDYTTVRQARTVRQRTLNLVRGVEPNVATDIEPPTNLDGILNKLSRNTVYLIGIRGDNIMRARCTALYGKTLLVVRHYYEFFRNNGFDEVEVASRNGSCCCRYKLSELKFTWVEESGYGICDLPASYPTAFSKITHLICSEKFGGSYPSEALIVENNLENSITRPTRIQMIKSPVHVPDMSKAGAWTITQGFSYAWGGRGKCGSLILVPSLSSPIVGIHTAGVGTERGWSELLRRETFSEVKNDLQFVEPQLEEKDNIYGLDGYYSQEGAIPNPIRSSNETCIRESEIHGVFPVTTEPAPLSGKDERLSEQTDIFKIGVSKRCQPTVEFDSSDVDRVVQNYCDSILSEVKPMRTPIAPLTVTQAIEGLPIPGMAAPITMSTAEGFPWKDMRPAGESNKSWMFQLDTHEDGKYKVIGVLKDLNDILNHKMDQRKRGLVPCSYFTPSMKDARILKEKISIPGKTRIFEISPIDLTIAQRQMFYDYSSSYVNSRFEHTIGINPDGPEWSDLANSLVNFSPHILTADYSSYGPRLSKTILGKAFDIATIWSDHYEEEDDQVADERFLIRQAIKHEVADGLHVAKDLVFRPTSGLPSGNCETINKNSECNSMYIRLAFLGLAKKYKPEYNDLYWFKKMVLMYSNGDDLIMSVKPEIIEWFNNTSLIEFFGDYDIKMTDALKSGVVRPYCTIEEATYLKRGFTPHPFRKFQWLAPLEKSSVTDTANWIWKSRDPTQASFVNSEMCSRLSYTLGEKEYNRISSTLKKAWEEKGARFEYPLWITLDKHIWEGTEGPKYSF